MRLIYCLLMLFVSQFTFSQSVNDSIPERNTNFFDRMGHSKLYKATYVSVPLIAGGLIVKNEDDDFRKMRSSYLPRFHSHIDDFTQYLPAAVMLGMKAGGIEGRSSWGRMLASDAFSVALMAGVVNTLKFTTNVTRPDGSNRHSFPSGHTATAFMTAVMLSKEYGTKYPWIPIGAYTVATSTGLMRMANNKHWLSDVMVGAGIGILSTEMGYYLADLIMKDKGLNHNEQFEYFERFHKPSFLGIYVGFNIPLSGYELGNGRKLYTSSGCTAGIEGAYFLNPYIGIGGRLASSNISYSLDNKEAQNNDFEFTSVGAGGYFSYPIALQWLVGAKLIGEYAYYKGHKGEDFVIGNCGGIGFGTGTSVTFKAHKNFNMRFFLDYDVLPSCIKKESEYVHTLTIGLSTSIAF